jgi:hypothetical protein
MSRTLEVCTRFLQIPTAAMACTLCVSGQSLQITSPAQGAVVNPGQTVTVTVTTSGTVFSGVLVMGDDPLDACEALAGPPFQCSIQIPIDIDPGTYTLTASGATSSNNSYDSDPVSIDVERPDSPTSIATEPAALTFHIGDKGSLRVIGTYSDGSSVDLSNSTQTTYESESPDIVTVGPGNLVTAVGAGSTQIVINGSVAVAVTVDPPVNILPSAATVTASQSRQFVAFVTTHPENPAVTWSLRPSGMGAIDTTGLYTAPDSISSEQTVMVTATSVADSTLTASATITLSPAASISVSPGWSVVYPGQSEQLTASASNVGTSGLSWSISPAGLGSISSTGLYTAPGTVNALQPVTVTATSVANSAYSATTAVWISPQPFQLVRSPLGVTVPQGGSATVMVNQLTTDLFSDPIAYSASGLPSGVTATFSPVTVSGTADTIVTFTASAATAPGNYTVSITGADTTIPGLSQSKSEFVSVSAAQPVVGFAISAGTGTVTGLPGETATVALTQTQTDQAQHTVTLSVNGLPSGVTASFSVNPVTSQNNSSVLTFSIGASVTPGTYPLTLNGNDAATGASQTTNLSLIVLPLTVESGTLPAGWINQDLGQPSVAGQTSFTSRVFQLESSGGGLDAAAAGGDQLQYAFTALEGDGTLIARATTMQSSDAQAGIMIRGGLDPRSPYVLLSVSGGGISLVSRSSYGAQSAILANYPDVVQMPIWLELVRQGNVFSAAMSFDGANWMTPAIPFP